MTTAPFRLRLAVRIDDLDPNGHVRGPAYLTYADQARWACVRAAGVSVEDLLARGVGPVNLETTIRFRKELLAGDEVDVSFAPTWDGGKTSRVVQELRRPDGTLVAEVTSVSGLLDLKERRLVPDAGMEILRSAATRPELLGL